MKRSKNPRAEMLFIQASFQVMQGNYRMAITYYEGAISIDPTFVGSWMGLAAIYRILHDDYKAIQCLKKVIEINPNDQDSWFSIGRIYEELGDYEEAIDYYENGLKLDYQDPNSKLKNFGIDIPPIEVLPKVKEIARRELGFNIPTTEEQWKKMIEAKEPEQIIKDILNRMANIYFKLGNYPKTLEYCEKILQKDSADETALSLISKVYAQSENYEEIIEYCERALQINPNLNSVWLLLANAYKELGNIDAGLDCMFSFLEREPQIKAQIKSFGEKLLDFMKNSPNKGPEELRKFLIKSGLREDGVVFFYPEQALELSPEKISEPVRSYINQMKKFWLNEGSAYLNSDDIEKAVESFERALEFDPNYKKAWNLLARTYMRSNNYQKAIECFDKEIKLDQYAKEAWISKADVYVKLNNYQKVIECCKKAIEIDPIFEDAWKLMGDAYNNLSNSKKASECFSKVNEINKSAKNYEKELFRKTEKSRQGKKVLEKKTRKKTKKIKKPKKSWLDQALDYRSSGKHQEAIECCESALEKDPTNSQAWELLGELYVEIGEYLKADECFKKVKDEK